MMKVRGEWGFSTAGRTLLCLTLTGVSGKSWLSCRHTRGRRSFHFTLGSQSHCTQYGLLSKILKQHKVPFLLREIHLLTLSIVPVRRIPTCCILLVAPRVRLQLSKKGLKKKKRKKKSADPFVPICSSRTKSFWNFFSY